MWYVTPCAPVGDATPGIRMSWIYRPSLALGGDLFNLSAWDDRSAYFYILDASGHGVSPALRAASFATFLRAENLRHCITQNDPAAMLREANRRYPLTADGSYFTIWIGSFDRTTQQLRYATAGHGGALIERRDGAIEWLTRAHLPLGFEADTTYELTTVNIADGDRVILMSDGIYEAPAPTGELWGTSRLETTLKAHRSAPLGEALPALMAEAERWHGSPVFPDDAALLGLEFRI